MKSRDSSNNAWQQADQLTKALETELHRRGQWQSTKLPDAAFEDMGTFGARTMSFQQWLQLVLIPRLQSIVADHAEFPPSSLLATYAVRELDGDPESDRLIELLRQIDELVNGIQGNPPSDVADPEDNPSASPDSTTITLGGTTLPAVCQSLADVLPLGDPETLESNLQTFDSFLEVLSPKVRPELSALLLKAAGRTSDSGCRARIESAAHSIANGGRAAAPHDHQAAMKAYTEEHRRNFGLPAAEPDPEEDYRA